jgi:hypothetical protein
VNASLYVFLPYSVVKDVFLVEKIPSGQSRSLKNRLKELDADKSTRRKIPKTYVSLRTVVSNNKITWNNFLSQFDNSQNDVVSLRRTLLEREMKSTGLPKFLCEQHNANSMNMYGFTDFNRQMINFVKDSNPNLMLDSDQEIKGLKKAWAFDQDDRETLKWRPQGIACDLYANTYGMGRKYIVVSWYNYNDDVGGIYGTRLSFINIYTWEYCHVLLVQPSDGDKDFEAADGHAGGIAWYGDYIYVASKNTGFQVYNINHLMRAKDNPAKDKVGIYSDGFYAYDYKYFLPQTGVYNLNEKFNTEMVFSFVSIVRGNSETPDCLLSGEFDDNQSHPTRLSKWALDSSGLLSPFIEQPFGTKKIYLDKESVQGAAEALGYYWFSQSGNPSGEGYHNLLHQLSRVAQIGSSVTVEAWPKGAEDLDFDDSDNSLWCLTEYESNKSSGARKIFNVDLAAY